MGGSHRLLVGDAGQGLWEEVSLGQYVLGFGQDLSGEVYVLTTDMTGPAGNTGMIFKIVRP
jgi:hypothetical protein